MHISKITFLIYIKCIKLIFYQVRVSLQTDQLSSIDTIRVIQNQQDTPGTMCNDTKVDGASCLFACLSLMRDTTAPPFDQMAELWSKLSLDKTNA